jgi:RNA polymerase sigma-70 factor (ECF subfamily)
MDLFAFDDDYVRRLREGDRWTEEHYVNYFTPLLTSKLRGNVSPNDIEDVIQDTLMRVLNELKNGKGIRDGHAFGAYVLRFCNNIKHEHLRGNRPTVELKDVYRSEDDALRDLITKEKIKRVRLTLLWLAKGNKRDAAILRDLFFNDCEKDAVCQKYGVDRDYLRVLVHRALKKFREKYGGPDDS